MSSSKRGDAVFSQGGATPAFHSSRPNQASAPASIQNRNPTTIEALIERRDHFDNLRTQIWIEMNRAFDRDDDRAQEVLKERYDHAQRRFKEINKELEQLDQQQRTQAHRIERAEAPRPQRRPNQRPDHDARTHTKNTDMGPKHTFNENADATSAPVQHLPDPDHDTRKVPKKTSKPQTCLTQGQEAVDGAQEFKIPSDNSSCAAQEIMVTASRRKTSANDDHTAEDQPNDSGSTEENAEDKTPSTPGDDGEDESEEEGTHGDEWVISRAETQRNKHKKYDDLTRPERAQRDQILANLRANIRPKLTYTRHLMPISRIPYNCPSEIRELGMPFLSALEAIWEAANYQKAKVDDWLNHTARILYPQRPDARLGSRDIRRAARLMRDAKVRAETMRDLMDARKRHGRDDDDDMERGGAKKAKYRPINSAPAAYMAYHPSESRYGI